MKVVGEPDEGKPHVRFDVAGDENQDMAMVLRHSQKKWGVNRLPSPKPQASSLDPTSGQGFALVVRGGLDGNRFGWRWSLARPPCR